MLTAFAVADDERILGGGGVSGVGDDGGGGAAAAAAEVVVGRSPFSQHLYSCFFVVDLVWTSFWI